MKPQSQIEAIINGLISYLEEKKSLDLLPQIAQELIKQSWVRIDPNLAIVSTPIALEPNQIQKIKTYLSKTLSRPVWVKAKIDKSIIAGLRIEIAGQVIDGTINRQLQELKQQVIYA